MPPSHLPLSAAIVCKNNRATISRTLDSVAPLCTEIVAIDSGSTDGTLDILAKYNARIVHSEWLGHIRTKQLALETCTRPWAFCIDSDESIEPDLAASITAAVSANTPGINGYKVNRKVYYQGKPLNYAWQPELRCRLVRTGGKAKWQGIDPHDVLAVIEGSEPHLKGTLRHDSFDTFLQQLSKQVRYAEIQARATLSPNPTTPHGHLISLLVSPPAAFLKQLVLKRAFLDGWPGWLAASCAGAQALMKHAAIIEMSRLPSSSTGNESDSK